MSLWTRTQKNERIGSPQSRTHEKRPHSRETSLCIYHKASYTVEAVVVIPLMAAFFASLLFFFRILQIQVIVEEALVYAGRKVAVESSLGVSEEVLLASAKGYMLYALEENKVIEQYVQGGSLGVLLLGSRCQEEEILLQASYEVSMPVAFWEIGRIPLYTQNSFSKWNGDRDAGIEGEWVYITDNGTVYHISPNCRVLDLSIREVELSKIDEERGKNRQRYYPCEDCCTENKDIVSVYCTDYGNRYHIELSCMYLKRSIHKISKREIGERLLCSFCNEGD